MLQVEIKTRERNRKYVITVTTSNFKENNFYRKLTIKFLQFYNTKQKIFTIKFTNIFYGLSYNCYENETEYDNK